MRQKDETPSGKYITAFNAWFNSHRATLNELYSAFLSETNSSKHEEGCSYSEFCVTMFENCEAGIKAEAIR